MRHALIGLVLAACASGGGGAPRTLIDMPADEGEDAPVTARRKITCSVADPKGVPTPYGHLSHAADVAFRSYYLAETRARQSVLLWLGPAGELSEAKLPAAPSTATREGPRRLRFLVESEPPRWFTVDLSDPDKPVVAAAAAVPGLKHEGTLKAFVSDGERALVGRYVVDYDAKPTRYYGETALFSVPEGKRTSPALAATAWSGACRARRCVAAASREGLAVPIELYGIEDSGSKLLGALDESCAGWADWVEGARWIIARPSKAGLELIAIDLGSWRVTRKRVPSLGDCPSVRQAELGGRTGVLVGQGQGGSTFYPISAELAVGEPESLPMPTYGEQTLVPMPDGALVVEQRIGHGMMHSPTDSHGVRRYFRVWSFDGRAVLLRPKPPAAWRPETYARLPHSGEEGEFSDGFRARPLVRPGFAAVLVDDMPGGNSELVHVGRPCAP